MTASDPQLRRFVSPVGRLTKWRFVTVQPADPQPFVTVNTYPKQVIGVVFRLPDGEEIFRDGSRRHYGLSIVWAKPARWWK